MNTESGSRNTPREFPIPYTAFPKGVSLSNPPVAGWVFKVPNSGLCFTVGCRLTTVGYRSRSIAFAAEYAPAVSR